MKALFEHHLPSIVSIGIALLLGKLAATTIAFWLPSFKMQNCPTTNPYSTFRSVNPAKAFSLKREVIIKPQAQPKPITLPNFTLYLTSMGKPSMALISDGHKKRLLKIGDSFHGWRLTAVYKEYVILKKEAKSVSLYMYKNKKHSIQPQRSRHPQKNISIPKIPPIQHEGNRYAIPRTLIREMYDLKKIFRNIALMPFYRDHHLVGFSITYIKRGSVFEKMGLKKRDIILKVNGKPLQSEADGFRYFNLIESFNTLTLTIQRNKAIKELIYEIY